MRISNGWQVFILILVLLVTSANTFGWGSVDVMIVLALIIGGLITLLVKYLRLEIFVEPKEEKQ